MKMRYTLLLLLCLTQTNLWAQYNLKENNVWMFGYHAGLDFNSGTAVPIQSAMNYNTIGVPDVGGAGTVDACASVCDTSGQLLFYSSGDTIYNRLNQIMPNGYGLMPIASSSSSSIGGLDIPCATMNIDTLIDTVEGVIDTTYDTVYVGSGMTAGQGTVIVPVFSNPDQYYVFSLQTLCFGDPGAGRLFYSVVDMSLNGGLGGVVPSEKGIMLDTALTTKMIAIPGDNCDMWLLVHGNENDSFIAFNITEAGINPTPVVSGTGNIGGVLSYTLGDMEISPNRRKLAIASTGFFGFGGIGTELCDFDPATGIVSNSISIGTDAAWGVAFSPDNTKMYVNQLGINPDTNATEYISQYDISLPTTTDIVASRTDVYALAYAGGISDIALGPDGKMYILGVVSLTDTNVLHVINDPNAAGTACQFAPFSLTLDTGTFVSYGIRNMYMKPLRDTVFTSTDTSMVLTSNLTLQIPSGYFNYLWNDGSTDSGKVITDTGTYWVKYGNYCTYRTDTFVVRQATGVAQIKGADAASLTAYPSPARSIANVTIHGLSKVDGTLQLIDMVGRVVQQEPCNTKKQTLDVADMAPGVYIVLYTDRSSAIQLHQQLVITK